MKRNRKILKKRSGRTLLSMLLAAALTVGGLTTAFATDSDVSETQAAVEVAEETLLTNQGITDTGAGSVSGYEGAGSNDDAAGEVYEETFVQDIVESYDSDVIIENAAGDSDDEEADDGEAEEEVANDEDIDDEDGDDDEDAEDEDDDEDLDEEDGDDESGDGFTEDGLSDDTADVETAADWEATLPKELTEVWADDLITVAKSQLGYTESTLNYRVNEEGRHKGYTRYGAWYGDPYGDWCAMFASFCLHYAGIPTYEFPEYESCWAWTIRLDELGMYKTADSGYVPVPGDLIFFDNNSSNGKPIDHVGIITGVVTEYNPDGSAYVAVKTIEGNASNAVRERSYDIGNSRIVGYGVLPENPDLADTAGEVDTTYGLWGGYDGQDSMDDPDSAGSCVGWDVNVMSAISSPSGLWWIDDYYIGESSQYDTEKTDDFSLKYQVEFHASEDLDAGAVQIVIDASLGTYRDGTNILPTDIGIPYGTPDNYTTSSSSPFNYYYFYYDGNGNEVILTASQAASYSGEVYIKVWNYRDIVSGSNAMFQILYEKLDIMQIPDQTEWSLEVSAEVDITTTDDDGSETTTTEIVNGNTLHGIVDTYATLNSVTKKAYTSSSASYTPELYTESQVSSYISGSIPEPYASNFDDYIYIVWQVSASGRANQSWTLTQDYDNTYITVDGETKLIGAVVGTSASTSSSSTSSRTISKTYYVVTAYSKAEYEALVESYGQDGVILENDVQMSVHPQDGYDEDTTRSASATTTWGEYEWNYSGNTIGITKGTSATYRAYLTLYEINAANEKDTGSFPFTVNSTDRGYGFTHYTDGTNVGQWIEGSYYTTTTVDDVLYVYPNGGTSDSRMLTKDDYYYSAVSITASDTGYDVWEDKTATPEQYDGVDQSVYIYAMFYDADGGAMDEDGWEYVATVPFSTGSMTYTFTSSDLARQPYRVKVVHSTANYSTSCSISLSVMLRADSPVIGALEQEYGDDLDSLRIENLCGVAGQVYGNPNYADGTYFQDTSTSGGNYSEHATDTGETLAEFTEDLYGTILQRDNAYITLTRLEETAGSYKSVTTENDVANGRVLANYTITAYEAYYVTGSSTVDALKETGISLPARNDVSYYDLLPYGMQFNANATVTAGRITTMSGSWQTNANAWSTAGVTVTVNEDDVITNWNGTGRTMVIFHIHYDGDDASAYYNNLWFQGYGISFQAYYDWTEMDQVDAEYNIAAYIAENVTEDSQQLLGTHDSKVYKDDGSANLSDQYAPFEGVSDLNGDGVTDLYTNMYASATTTTNVATSSSDDIKKTVRADSDAVANYGSTAVVGNGQTYTYEITLENNGGATLSDIVIFDRLEYAVEDGRYEIESAGSGANVFDGLTSDQIQNHWTGTFLGVTVTALDDLGIDYTIYYNADRNAPVSSENGETTPKDVLNGTNGWFTEADFITIYGSLSSALAIAVDLGDFEMDPESTVSIQIHMQAPEDSEYQYAFNNPMYYSVSTDMIGDKTAATDSGDTVRVELGEAGTLEVEKEFAEGAEIPASMQNARFTFEITRSGQILANQEYMIYTWNGEEWVSSGVVSATDTNGRFTLRAGQKAVFSIVDVEDVVVTEVESVFWDSDKEETDTTADPDDPDSVFDRYDTFTNTYRSPVYLYKTVLTTDLASDEELEDAEFTFRIMLDLDGDGIYETPYVGEYIYVKSVLTDGSSPEIDTSKGESGYGYITDGSVTLHIGDIIVFFPTDEDGNYINIPYQITETETGDDWTNMGSDTAGGTTGEFGTAETITNYYKYRNLILTKDLSDYDHDLDTCEDEWTFRLTDADENPVTGNHWYMIDANGDPVYTEVDGEQIPVEGYLDENGEFSFTGAGNGRRVVIEKLVEGEKYTLTEINYDAELYEEVNEGTVDTTMPIYAITRSIVITNKYLLKDLSISKLVLSSDTEADLSGHEFTFTLEKLVDGEYVPVAGAVYTIDGVEYETDEKGQFTLKHGGEAYFDDIGYMDDVFRVTETPDSTYGQIYPANGDPYEGSLSSDGASARFINGDFDEVVSLTKNLVGLDEVGEAYVDIVKGDNTAATLVGEEGDVPYTVEVTFGVYDGDNCVTTAEGELFDYAEGNTDYPYVYIKISADGTYVLKSYNGGVMTETLAPYDYIYIAEIGSYTVKASESADMERILLDVTNDVAGEIGSDQILSEGDVMSGSAAANENIVLVNDISSANKESEIYKLMTETSEEVTTGSQITFIVQIYDEASGTWSPVSGIKYITMDGYTGEGKTDDGVTYHDTSGCWPTSGVLTTGSEGRITLTKTDDGYPYIRFIEDVVYANVYDDAEDGTLRIIETESGTDESWGSLVGYDGEGWVGGPSLDITYADTFYDGNDSSLQFEVEKEMVDDIECDDDFTFYLKQILSASTSPITSMDQILESEAGASVSYDIFDVQTGEKIGEGVTNADGSFTLKPGQYARFYVPADTTWYVYEGINPGYPLESAEANDDPNDENGKWGYADNASIVDETNGVVQETTDTYASGTIILTLTDSDTGQPLAGGIFDLYKDGKLYQSGLVTDAYGQIIITGCTPSEYYFVETEAPSEYEMPENMTTDTAIVESGLSQVKEYPLSMENETPGVKYAVRIYGIYADDYSLDGGSTTESVKASLTFGPATGASYINSYVSCASDTCIHNLSWDEIIDLCQQNQGDEDALRSLFGSCLENGCTTSVNLHLNDTIGTVTRYSWIGDGTGELYDSINSTYRKWNYTEDPGYYPSSRLRATLNGSDSYTDLSVAGTDALDANTCLFSCFPSSLRSAIVPKVVESGTGYTTYDKLWLFSQNELWGYEESNEGSQYEYLRNAGVTGSSRTNDRALISYTEQGTSYWWWSRSRYDSERVYSVNTSGQRGTSYPGGSGGATNGLSPGFCIE